MPKIRIKERDLTTNPLVGSTTNYILYVMSTDNQTEWAKATAKSYYQNLQEKLSKGPFEITLEEAKNFEEAFGGKSEFLSKVIELGGKIIIAYNWDNYAVPYCGDRNQYDIKFILAKEVNEDVWDEKQDIVIPTQDISDLSNALIIAQKRKDCVIVYTKTTTSYSENEKIALTAACNYITEDTKKEFYSDEVKRPVGKYVLAFYAPNENTGGLHTEDGAELDAGKAYILAFLDNVAKGRAEWLAIAGATRGAIPGNYKVDGFLKEEEIDNMQLRTYNSGDDASNIAINPIVNMNPWGTRIWGNRTCLPNTNVTTDGEIASEDEGNVAPSPTDQLVASSFANIRIALCDIKKAIYKAARQYQFEQNTDVLWVNFTSSVNSLLEQMKSSYGIVGYRWKRDSANEQRGELRAILQVTPIEAVEDFTVTVELKDSLDNNVQIAE